MNILGLSNQFSGCGYHRVFMPLGFLPGAKSLVTDIPQKEHFARNFDLILYNRTCIIDQDWQQVKDTLKAKIVCDLDDYWVLPPAHQLHATYAAIQQRIEDNIKAADLVTVTNERLRQHALKLNSNVEVIPNGLPFGRNQFTLDKRDSDLIRIFWAGGSSHEKDMDILRNPIKKLHTHKDKIQMVIGGFTSENEESKRIWERMFSCFTSGGTLPYMKLSGGHPTSYMQLYENADIMLIPLEKSDWHSCKSNLKVLEAASKKIPCIVSRVEPYSLDTDAPVLWVDTQKDWNIHLNNLILNPKLRIDLGEQLYEWAKEKYDLIKINERRKELFRSIIEA